MMITAKKITNHLFSIARALYVLATATAVFVVLVKLNFGGF